MSGLPVSDLKCPICGAGVKWFCQDTGSADCQDGGNVSRRIPGGKGPPCRWAGTRLKRVDGRVVTDGPIRTDLGPAAVNPYPIGTPEHERFAEVVFLPFAAALARARARWTVVQRDGRWVVNDAEHTDRRDAEFDRRALVVMTTVELMGFDEDVQASVAESVEAGVRLTRSLIRECAESWAESKAEGGGR